MTLFYPSFIDNSLYILKMQSWVGLRTRASFDCESRRHYDWQNKTEKYGLTRRQWSVYQSLLLFMYSPPLILLPEIVSLIIRRAFSIAISERMNTTRMISDRWWLKAKCYRSRLNEEPAPEGLVILTYYRAHDRDHDEDGIATLTNIDIHCYGDGFICKDVDDNLCYIPDRLLNDDWLRTGSSSIRDNELYHSYLWDKIGAGLMVFAIALYWFYDWLVINFGYSRYISHPIVTVFSYVDNVFECTDNLSCLIGVHVQCILNSMWFTGLYTGQLFPSLVIHNTTMTERPLLYMVDSLIYLLVLPLEALLFNIINTTGTLLV